MTTPSVNPSLPANYDAVDLWIHPSEVSALAGLVIFYVQKISGEIVDVMNTLNGLKLGWAGTSASEAETFFTEWSALMTDMFGTQNDASSGVLNAICSALNNAAQNFDAQEDYIIGMFQAIQAAITAPSSATPQTPATPAINDPTKTAVSETFG